jgi:hypothetical protein
MSNRKIILNAIGPQDDFLTKEPITTHLKSQHKKHTNFAKNIIKICPTSQQADNIPYNFGEIIPFDIDKSADLLLNISLELIVEGEPWADSTNVVIPQTLYGLIDYIEILSDTTVLQKLTGEWLYIWDQLYSPNGSNSNIPQSAYASQINQIPNTSPIQHKLLLKIPFWFSSSPGLALPLWAIQHERIHIRLKLRNKNEICLDPNNTNINIKSIQLIAEIIDLDKLEKDKFQNTELEYLIEQIEFSGTNLIQSSSSNSRKKIEIQRFPYVNEIFWVFTGVNFQENTEESLPDQFNPANYFNYWLKFDGNPNTRLDHTKNTTILLNGNPINQRLKGSYYRKITRYESHDVGSCKGRHGEAIENPNTYSYNCIYSYSFSFNPQNIKPAGFLSTDKFNSIHLDIDINSALYDRKLNIYIKRFNIIRIQDGHINLLNT